MGVHAFYQVCFLFAGPGLYLFFPCNGILDVKKRFIVNQFSCFVFTRERVLEISDFVLIQTLLKIAGYSV